MRGISNKRSLGPVAAREQGSAARARVLHVITGLSTGGAERSLHKLLVDDRHRSRYEAAVISLRDSGTFGPLLAAEGVPLRALDIRGRWPGARAMGALWRAARAVRPHIVQGWMYHGNLAASVVARLAPGHPAVAWNVLHCLDDFEKEKESTRWAIRMGRWFSPTADAVLYNGRRAREQHQAFGFAGTRTYVIPGGFDLSDIGLGTSCGARVREELGIPMRALVVGHVARFHPVKDHANFLRAVTRIADSVPTAHFLMVGRGVETTNPDLVRMVPPSLLSRFRFAGERSDVPRLLHAMDLFCQSSRSEAFSNALGEAMASGVPCVATDVGDTAELVGNTGIIVPPFSDGALADGLLKMLASGASEREKLGSAARMRVATHFGRGAVASRYDRIYSGIAPHWLWP